MEAVLDRMIDRCQSGAQGSVQVGVEDLISILGLTDRQAAVTICGLYSKVGAVFFCFFFVFVCRFTALSTLTTVMRGHASSWIFISQPTLSEGICCSQINYY